MVDLNHVCLLSVSLWRREDFDVCVVEEFRMTHSSQHFGEDLIGMDGVVGAVYFECTFTSILLAFGLVESLGLRLTIIGGWGYFESNFIVGAIPSLLNRLRVEGISAVPHPYARPFFRVLY